MKQSTLKDGKYETIFKLNIINGFRKVREGIRNMNHKQAVMKKNHLQVLTTKYLIVEMKSMNGLNSRKGTI